MFLKLNYFNYIILYSFMFIILFVIILNIFYEKIMNSDWN